ncbi:MAG: YfbU family protein [Bryobacteraceae bacterium]|nr:YfbU family protein [Bryobacteraceae bacterium]
MDNPETTTLTPAERLQLVNQYRILEALYPDEAEHYAEHREIVAEGITIRYGELFGELSDEIDVIEGKYVCEVLDMYKMLLGSFLALEDKQGLTEKDVRFRGFDGHSESGRLALARHFEKLERWEDVLTGDIDSHTPSTIYQYPPMLERYQPMMERLASKDPFGWRFSASQIKEIIGRD